MPLTTPAVVTVPTAILPLLHIPDGVALVSVKELPTQTEDPPVIASTAGTEITGTDAEVVDDPHTLVAV
jgi:hypothetical protein